MTTLTDLLRRLCVCVFILTCTTSATEHAHSDGDVIVAGLFDIYDSVSDECSNTGIVPSSVKDVEAIKWTLQKLNEQNYIPGVKIGFEAWPTCGLVGKSNDRTIDLINRILEDKKDVTYRNPPVVGLIGPEHSSQAGNTSVLIGSLRATDRLVQIGYSTTATSLSNRNLYPNLFRVVPNDEVQIEVMISLLKELEWNYIVVMYDIDIYGIEGHEALRRRASDEDICIVSAFPIAIDSKGAVSQSAIQQSLEKTIEHSVSGVVVFSSRVNILLEAARVISGTKSDPITFLFSEGIGLSGDSVRNSIGIVYDSAKGSFVVTPPLMIVDEFEIYWTNLFKNVSRVAKESETNKWLRDVYAYYSKVDCVPSNNSVDPKCEELDQTELNKLNQHYLYTSYAIKAAYVMAKLIKDTHLERCSNQNGLCDNLKAIFYTHKGFLVDKIKDFPVDFATDFPFTPQALKNFSSEFVQTTGILNISKYEVHHFRSCLENPGSFCFESVGHFKDFLFRLNTSLIRDYHSIPDVGWPKINRAQCPNGRFCSSCIVKDNSEDVFYEPGDVIVGGIIPIHNKDSDDPLKCVDIRTSLGVEIAESMAFGVLEINRRIGKYKDLFPGIKIGFLFIDSCNQRLVVQRKVLDILQRGVKQKDGTYVPIAHKIIGWIGAYGSSMSIESSRILSQVGMIQIAYASTAAILSDRIEHPYFMRTCTPDDKQAKAMIKIIQKLKSNFIQVVYSEGTYGEGGRDAIRQEAQTGKVCIKNEIMVIEGENYLGIIDILRKYSFARIVILFLRSHIVDAVTTALNERLEEGEFMFIGSEAWGYRPDQFQNKKKLIGSITLALQMAQNKNFTNYLDNLDIFSNTHDPWIKSYAEKKFDCYFTTSFDKRGSKICDRNLRLTYPNVSYFNQEIWTPFALNAMIVLLVGANAAYKDLCGTDATSFCDHFQAHPMIVRNRTMEQMFDVFGDGNPIRVFDSNGDGNVGYKIFNIQRKKEDVNILIYGQVGQSPLAEADFRFDTENVVTPEGLDLPSVCPNEKECTECFSKDNGLATVIRRDEDDKKTATVLGVFVGILTFAVTGLIIIVMYLKCRNSKNGTEDTYLDAMDPYLQVNQCSRDSGRYTTDLDQFSKNQSDDSGCISRHTSEDFASANIEVP